MSATQIMHALEDIDGVHNSESYAAKCGFLEWALCLPAGANPCAEARKAVQGLKDVQITTSAGALFLQHLKDACIPVAPSGRRGGASGRRRILH